MWKALPVLVALVVLAGCGTSPEPQTPAAVAKAYRSWDDSSIAGNSKVACARMTDRFLKFEIASAGTAPTCAALIKDTVAFVKQHPETKRYTISGIVVNGDHATLTDRTPYDKVVDTAKMSLVRENGRWKVDTQIVVKKASPNRPPPAGLTS